MKWLVVGAGSIGLRHLNTLHGIGEDMLACVEPREEQRKHAGEFCGQRMAGTLDEALEAGQADVAIICTPTTQHMGDAIQCAKAGLHVIVEKPVSNTMDRKDELIEALGDRIGMVAGQLRFHPGMMEVKGLLDGGELGTVIGARVTYGHNLENWRPTTDYRESYSAHRDQGGGLLFDRIHELDYLRWLFGEPSTVYATMRHRSALDTDVEDVVEMVLDYGGIPVSVHLDMVSQVYDCQAEIICEKDTMHWQYQPTQTIQEICFRNQATHWLRVLNGDEEPSQTIEDGFTVLRTVLAAHKSARVCAEVSLSAPVCGEVGPFSRDVVPKTRTT